MNFSDIFEAYYNLYRSEADTPATTDDEYPVAIRLANEAINRWSSYDNTMWQELFTTLQLENDGDTTTVSGTTTYAVPANFKLPAGVVMILDTDGTRLATLDVIPVEEVQYMSDSATYCYFSGNPNTGFTLTLNPAPLSTWSGKSINYIYYKKPTLMTKGSSKPEMGDPYFIVNRMLANRFRSSRNPYYNTAKSDAEDALRMMQLQNNSGTPANPWTAKDRSGSSWGG